MPAAVWPKQRTRAAAGSTNQRMIDYSAQVEIARLKRTVAYISSAIINVTGGLSGVGRVSDYLALRAASPVNLTQDTVFMFADINGDPGLFALDESSNAADDGYTCVIDAIGRRWIRQGSPV